MVRGERKRERGTHAYLKYALERVCAKAGFDFDNKAGKSRIKDLALSIPVDSSGKPDLDAQQALARKYVRVDEIRKQMVTQLEELAGAELDL